MCLQDTLRGEFIIIVVVVVVVVVVDGRDSSISVVTKQQNVRPIYRNLIHSEPEIFPSQPLNIFWCSLSCSSNVTLFLSISDGFIAIIDARITKD